MSCASCGGKSYGAQVDSWIAPASAPPVTSPILVTSNPDDAQSMSKKHTPKKEVEEVPVVSEEQPLEQKQELFYQDEAAKESGSYTTGSVGNRPANLIGHPQGYIITQPKTPSQQPTVSGGETGTTEPESTDE